VRERSALVRLSADTNGGLCVSPLRGPAAPGRGAYVCPSLACLAKAWHRPALARALRGELPGLKREAMQAAFETELRRRGILGSEPQGFPAAGRGGRVAP
jgi:predicted RNA-binding protein YlxR (DUF448 family)